MTIFSSRSSAVEEHSRASGCDEQLVCEKQTLSMQLDVWFGAALM